LPERHGALTTPPDLVTIGEPLGVLLGPPSVPVDEAAVFDLQVSGAEVNVAIGMSRLGHRTALLSAVGDDPVGRRVLRTLRGESVDASRVRVDATRPTGLLLRDVVTARPTTVSYFRSGSAASALTPDDVDEAVVAAARLLHLTGITAALSESAFDTCVHAAQVARAAGVTVCFDPNVRLRLADRERWSQIVTTFAGLCDIAFPGDADLAASVGEVDPIAWCHARGATTVVLKQGSAGAVESSGGVVTRAAAHQVTAVDAIGAGDAFVAGWLSGWLRGLPADQRLREAAVVASCVVGTRGDLAGLPNAALRDQLLTSSAEAVR
jgi:2-dehydro-3-deoxygluconokinase